MKHKKVLFKLISCAALLSMVACAGNKPSTPSGDSTVPSSSEDTSSEDTSSSSEIDYGTVNIADAELMIYGEKVILPVFSKPEYEEDLIYTFSGSNISIVDGKITGLVPNTQTTVTASSEHFNTTFVVSVTPIHGVLTTETGEESKLILATPEASIKNYLLHATVEVPTYVTDYTRVCTIAFNGSSNSWYNMEMGDTGEIYLFAKFNNVEKYAIRLANKSELLVNNIIHLQIEILKEGQATKLFFGGKLVCQFDTQEMFGYEELSSIEITAAADRTNAGRYVVNLSDIYYDFENSAPYQEFQNKQFIIPNLGNQVLANANGLESKINFGDISMISKNFIFETQVSIEQYNLDKYFRASTLVFNDNGGLWYNIEIGGGNVILFGDFNAVPKYGIILGAVSDLLVDGHINYELTLLKQGQATWLFFNDKMVCSYNEEEMAGAANLGNLGIIAMNAETDYRISINDTKIEFADSENYKVHMASVVNISDITHARTDGLEAKTTIALAGSSQYVYSGRVLVKQDTTGFLRPTAFAFNDDGNTWFNIECNAEGGIIMYAKFGAVEKYGIMLGSKTECAPKEGEQCVFAYDFAILKRDGALHFFFNNQLKVSFSAAELEGCAVFNRIGLTSFALGNDNAYDVRIINQKMEDSKSENFVTYSNLLVA